MGYGEWVGEREVLMSGTQARHDLLCSLLSPQLKLCPTLAPSLLPSCLPVSWARSFCIDVCKCQPTPH